MFYTIILLYFISTNACFFQFLVVQQNFSAYSRSHHFATLDEQQSMQRCKVSKVWQHCARAVVIDKNTEKLTAWRKAKRSKSIDIIALWHSIINTIWSHCISSFHYLASFAIAPRQIK